MEVAGKGDILPSMSLEQLGLDAVKLGVPSVYSVWVGVDSLKLCTGEPTDDARPPTRLSGSLGKVGLVVTTVGLRTNNHSKVKPKGLQQYMY